jgi:tight adherence protein C
MQILSGFQNSAAIAWMAENLPFILIFLAAAFTVLGVGTLINANGRARQRLRERGGVAALADAPSIRFQSRSRLYRYVVEPLRPKLVPDDPTDFSSLARRLVQAGYRGGHAVAGYYVIRIILALALPMLLIILVPIAWRGLELPRLLLLAAIIGLTGYLAPTLYLIQRIAKRQNLFREAFPDALDLLLICSEAGLGLDAGIQRVGDEISKPYPMLGEQFRLMAAELRAGKSRDEALRALSERIGIDEVTALSNLLIQTDALGTSMGQALRALAEDMRQRRMLKAEEKAQKMGVKLSMILVIFILPALMSTILMPTVVAGGRLLFRFYGIHPAE